MVQYTATTKYHEFLSAVTQHAAEGILAYSRTGQIILANAALGQIFGMEVKDIETKNIADLIPESENRDETLASLFLSEDHNQHHAIEFNIKQESGDILPVDVMVGHTQLTDGEEIYIANWRDITERRKTEERLVRQAEIINQMHDSVLVAGIDFTVTEFNQAFADTLQMDRKDILGKNIYTLVDVVFPDSLRPEDVHEIALSAGRWHGIVEITNKFGRTLKADCLLFPMRDQAGNATYFISVIRDLTERIEAERRIQETQRIESLGRLAGGVAHDINNLLFPIFLNLEEAADNVEEEGILPNAVTAIRDSMGACKKIKEMIEQILHFSRGSSSGSEILDMSATVAEAWTLTKMIVPSSLKTLINIQPTCGTMTGNSVQISQILLNLVSNAIAALDQKPGTITISLAVMTSDIIPKPRYYAIRHQIYAALTVTDTGCGIPEEIMGRVLDPFFTTKGVGEGTGLGLTEVAGLVRDCDGAIDIRSKIDMGTKITIYFPVTIDSQVDAA